MKKTINYRHDIHKMPNRFILSALLCLSSATTLFAQNIDLDYMKDSKTKTANGYESWYIDNGSTTSTKKTNSGVSIVMTLASDTMTIHNNWYSMLIASDMQLNDGVHAYSKSGNNSGYCKDAATIQLSITGLSVGMHTLQAYHNYLDGSGLTLPTLSVAVGGVTQQTGIVQSQRAADKASAAKSFVTFTVTSSSTPVVIAYSSNPVSGTTYATTSFYINSSAVASCRNNIKSICQVQWKAVGYYLYRHLRTSFCVERTTGYTRQTTRYRSRWFSYHFVSKGSAHQLL